MNYCHIKPVKWPSVQAKMCLWANLSFWKFWALNVSLDSTWPGQLGPLIFWPGPAQSVWLSPFLGPAWPVPWAARPVHMSGGTTSSHGYTMSIVTLCVKVWHAVIRAALLSRYTTCWWWHYPSTRLCPCEVRHAQERHTIRGKDRLSLETSGHW